MGPSPRTRLLLAVALTLGACSDFGASVKPTPQGEVSATALAFGTVAVGQSVTRALTVTNTGTGTLEGTASLSCAGYSLQSGGGPFVLAGGESHTIVVEFAPGSIGTHPCTLDLGPDLPAIAMAGEAALQEPGAVCEVLHSLLDFGHVDSGRTVLLTTAVLNTGTAPLLVNVVSACGEFQVFGGDGPSRIPPGGSLAVTIAYQPTTSGSVSCVIEVGPDCPTITALGIGVTVSFADDVRPLLHSRCVSCHGWLHIDDPYGHLYLTLPGMIIGGALVAPLEPGDSILYGKLTPTPPYGARMPQGGPYLTDAEMAVIRSWISEGALDN